VPGRFEAATAPQELLRAGCVAGCDRSGLGDMVQQGQGLGDTHLVVMHAWCNRDCCTHCTQKQVAVPVLLWYSHSSSTQRLAGVFWGQDGSSCNRKCCRAPAGVCCFGQLSQGMVCLVETQQGGRGGWLADTLLCCALRKCAPRAAVAGPQTAAMCANSAVLCSWVQPGPLLLSSA
jgi:hypothetical protein